MAFEGLDTTKTKLRIKQVVPCINDNHKTGGNKKSYKVNKENYDDSKNCSWEKVLLTGNVAEIWKFGKERSRKIVPSVSSIGRASVADIDNRKLNRVTVMNRAERNIRMLVNANVSDDSLFITLTYAGFETDRKKTNYDFLLFVKRLQDKAGIKLQYLYVTENQERGSLHYHAIFFNLRKTWLFRFHPRITYEKAKELKKWNEFEEIKRSSEMLASFWGHGFCRVDDLTGINNVGAYLVKYMTKDIDDNLNEGSQIWSYSRGLKKPLEITNKDVIQDIKENYTLIRCDSYISKRYGICWHNILNKKVSKTDGMERTSGMTAGVDISGK